MSDDTVQGEVVESEILTIGPLEASCWVIGPFNQMITNMGEEDAAMLAADDILRRQGFIYFFAELVTD